MVYDGWRVFGPYKRKDGRLHVVLRKDKVNKTVSYPKYLMEIKLNRYLEEWETVDHIDRDFTNNDYSNLQILDRDTHIYLDAVRLKDVLVNCVFCNKEFIIDHKKINNRMRKKAGPFCSKECSGRYGSAIQNNQIETLDNVEIEKTYYYIDKK